MISCAAIQKLERYGQLGLKRRSVTDFIQSSLKDTKRANVYALTHIPTWTECLEALTQHNNTDFSSFPSASLYVSDSLLYAVSFAASFVAHHLDTQRGHCAISPDVHISPIFPTAFADAAALLFLLRRVAENCAASAQRGAALVGALRHLLSAAMDTALAAAVLRSLGEKDKDKDDKDKDNEEKEEKDKGAEGEWLAELCRGATGLFAAVAAPLRSAQAKPPSAAESISPAPFAARTVLAELQQLTARARRAAAEASRNTKDKKDTKDEREKKDERVCFAAREETRALVTARLVAWAAEAAARPGTLLAALAPFSAFQKISLLDAVVAEAPTSCCGVSLEKFRRASALLVAPSAGNRATRVVVYFRSNEMKMMQNNVRDASEYALYTHVTTPPVEEATLRGIEEMTSPPQKQLGALLLAQWMSSITLFFRSFCAEESWTAFAQEQRRMVLRQETSARRERRQQKRRGISVSDSASNCSESNNNNNDNSKHINEDAEDQHSIVSQVSGLSLASRASVLSTMSKASAASYHSFTSLIDAARGANNENNNNEEAAALGLHQSADGNTNLPLILLEEMTLGLKRFLAAAEKSDANTLIDTFSLRALAWRTVGDLYAFVQYTMTARGNALNTEIDDPDHAKENRITRSLRNSTLDGWASITPVFHLSHDIRYNRGMGYEVLGLLFANVVLPQLLEERSTTDAQPNRRDIETALTRCLAAYEVIAPQVIDQNVPDILRVAAHVAANPVAQQQQQLKQQAKENQTHLLPSENDGTSDDTTMLHRFLMSLLTRLGKGNQIPVLLDALVTLVKSASQTNKQGARDRTSNHHNEDEEEAEKTEEAEAEAEAEEEDQITVAGLHAIFSHPRVRGALVEACAVSLDPESLTARLVAYLSPWTLDERDGDFSACATRPSRLRPAAALFVLELAAAVLEGIGPTCLTASALLEQAAEVELALSTFLVNKLYATFFDDGDNEEGEAKRASKSTRKGVDGVFAGGEISSKLQRRFMLSTLHAIYQSRELVLSCLQDLGIQSVEVYLRMLEETLWQVESRVGALVGSLSIDDLHGTLSLTTQQRYAPFVHRATLLPRLALQRLCLARSVGAALDISINPKREARRLAAFVLCHMYPDDGDGVYASSEEGITRAFELANQLTEEQWHCLLQFSKPQRLRRTLVWLLRVSFTTAKSNMAHTTGWLSRCLRTCAGFLIEALYDIVVSVDDTEVLAAIQVSSPIAPKGAALSEASTNTNESENDQRTPLVQLCAALSAAVEYLGRIPQWPFLLERCVHWLRLLQAHAKDARHETNENAVTEATSLSLLERRLVQLTMTFLSCEEAVVGVLRRALMQQYTRHTEKEGHSVVNRDLEKRVAEKQRKVSKSQNEHRRSEVSVNHAFFETIGVSSIACNSLGKRDTGHVNAAPHEQEAEEENAINVDDNNDEDEDGSDNDAGEQHPKAKNTSDIYMQLAAHIFSPEFAALLVRHCSASSSENIAARVLQQLYNVALTSAQRLSRFSTRAPAHEEPRANNYALIFLDSVLLEVRRRCDAKDFSAVSAFLDSVGHTGTITFLTRHAQSNHHRQQREKRNVKESRVLSSSCSTREKELDQSDIPELSLQWIRLLAAMLPEVIRCISTERCKAITSVGDENMGKSHSEKGVNINMKECKEKKDKDELLLRAFAALYILLERHSLCVPEAVRGKRQRDTDEREFNEEKANRNTMSLASCAVAYLDGASLECINQIFAPGDEPSRTSSAATIAFLLSDSLSSLRTLWVLYSIHENHTGPSGHKDSPRRAGKIPDKRAGGAAEDWLSAVLQCYDPDAPVRTQAAALSSAASALLLPPPSSSSSPSPLSRRRAPPPPPPPPPPLPLSAAATRWTAAQLGATPDLLRAFPRAAPLARHMRRLLRAAVAPDERSRGGPDERSRGGPDERSRGADGDAAAAGRTGRLRALLRAGARALRELSAVPAMAFGSWRGDVKRLLVASGSLRLRGGNETGAAGGACDALFVDVLEVCALPLVTLHEDAGFIDHELAFLQGLLTGVELCGEETIRRVLHLLTRTLLPLNVLWRRAHRMPGLLAALSTHCLEGVARGAYSRVVLNQLSSFLFRLVRDAEGAASRVGVPAAVRSLCLASVTSCLFRLAAPMVNVFTTHSSDLDFVAADLLKALQRVHLPKRRAASAILQQKNDDDLLDGNEKDSAGGVWSDATMCDLSYACVGDSDSQSLLRLAAERVEEEDGNANRHIFMVPQ